MTLRAAFDDGRRHAPSLQAGIVILPDEAPLSYEAAVEALADLADATPSRFLHCAARVIEGRLALTCTPEGDPDQVAQTRLACAKAITEEREEHGARPEGPELLVVDGVDKRERFMARWEDVLTFVQRYRGQAFGGSWSRPRVEDAMPPEIGAVWHTHQAGTIFAGTMSDPAVLQRLVDAVLEDPVAALHGNSAPADELVALGRPALPLVQRVLDGNWTPEAHPKDVVEAFTYIATRIRKLE